MARKIKQETRAKRLANQGPASRYDQAYQVALNIVFMEEKLDQARELIGSTSVAIQYDNGGGQKGIRENPAFKGYHALLKSYIAAVEQLDRIIGAGDGEQEETSLADMRANFRANITSYKRAESEARTA